MKWPLGISRGKNSTGQAEHAERKIFLVVTLKITSSLSFSASWRALRETSFFRAFVPSCFRDKRLLSASSPYNPKNLIKIIHHENTKTGNHEKNHGDLSNPLLPYFRPFMLSCWGFLLSTDCCILSSIFRLSADSYFSPIFLVLLILSILSSDFFCPGFL